MAALVALSGSLCNKDLRVLGSILGPLFMEAIMYKHGSLTVGGLLTGYRVPLRGFRLI